MSSRPYRWFSTESWFQSWLSRRLPAVRALTLGRGNIFIVPSAAGGGLLALVFLLWLTATNYENNLVFAVTCLLVSIFHTAIYHSYANLSGLNIRMVRGAPAFAGESVSFVLRLSHSGKRARGPLTLGFGDRRIVVNGLRPGEEREVELTLPAKRRGWLRPERLWIESRYPLGLLRVWSRPLLEGAALVYPRPLPDAVETGAATEGRGEAQDVNANLQSGSEDFAGLRPWQRGDSPQRVAWSRVARGQGTLVKQYVDPPVESGWLDWDAYPHLDRERRLSALCAQLLEYCEQGHSYGLRLPGQMLEPASGESHRGQCLRALALFELPCEAGRA